MKKHILFKLAFIFICTTASRVQNVAYKNDTICTDGNPYCVMKSTGSFAKNFKVYNLHGPEFLRVIYDIHTTNYLATFLPDLEQCTYNF